MKTKKLLGFTLIELLIVIAIIGILAVAFLPSLLDAPAKSRDAQRLATVQKIENFLVSYTLEGNAFPTPTACIATGGGANTIGGEIDANIADFGGAFPVDPDPANVTTGAATTDCTGQYGYIEYTVANAIYSAAVYARMERPENANVKCADIKDIANPVIDANVVIGAGDLPCYLTLIQ